MVYFWEYVKCVKVKYFVDGMEGIDFVNFIF